MIKTIDLTANIESKINISDGWIAKIRNFSNSPVFVSKNPNITPYADEVKYIAPHSEEVIKDIPLYKNINGINGYNWALYAFSDGNSKIEIESLNRNAETVYDDTKIKENIAESTNLAFQAVLPSNKIFYDNAGKLSVMVWIPKMRICDVLSSTSTDVLPAFKITVNGTTREIDGFWFAKYQTKVIDGKAYSLPCEDPSVDIKFNEFVKYNRDKISDGKNWHEATNAEWAAIALYCHKFGFDPYGNNNFGKDWREVLRKAIPASYSNNRINRVKTGTGPISWSHDGTLEGIWDMNGNVWERIIGVRLINGEVQIIKDNDASLPSCDLSENSSEWKAIDAETGTLITPNGSGTTSGSIKLDFQNDVWTYSTQILNQNNTVRKCLFKDVSCDSTISAAAKLLLQTLTMLPDTDLIDTGIDTSYGNNGFWANNAQAERYQIRGGCFDGVVNPEACYGMFDFNLNLQRDYSSSSIGGRSALIEMEV